MNENVDEHTSSHNNIFLLRRAVKGGERVQGVLKVRMSLVLLIKKKKVRQATLLDAHCY